MLHSVPLDHLADRGLVAFSGQRGGRGGILVYDGATVTAWVNLCPHWSLPLDHSGPLATDAEGRLICATHDARFRTSDGACVAGPCEGQRLEPLEVELADGVVRVYSVPELAVGVTAPWGAVRSPEDT